MKKCSKCGETKPINSFYKDKHSKDGHKASCIQCEKLRHTCICQYCRVEFKSSDKNAKYCSSKCRGGNVKCTCTNCSKEYETNRYNVSHAERNFCSKACYWEYNTGKNNPLYKRENISCSYCNKPLKRQPARLERSEHNYCSIDCKNKHHSKLMEGKNNSNYKGRISVKCPTCNKAFYLIPALYNTSKEHYCSCECKYIALRKRYSNEGNPNYNPGLTQQERETTRHIQGYKEWVLEVYDRDKYACVNCGESPSGELIAHHLNSYHWDKSNRLNAENGATLCKKCHKEFHNIYGYKNNTKKQFEEFIISKLIRMEE